MPLDADARRAFMAYVVLLVAALLVMTIRMDPTGTDRSASGGTQAPQNAPVSPTLAK